MTAEPSDLPPTIGPPPPGGWTTEDLDALPDDGVRRELLDGVLLVRPSPTPAHQVITMRLAVALEESCPLAFQVIPGVEIRFGPALALIPDVLVAAAQPQADHYHHPRDVLLAVEIVSPTSQSMDRITKPALYAGAGIPFYWRIETDRSLTVHMHQLDPEHHLYRPTGIATDKIETADPWPISLEIKRLIPRNF